MLRVVLETNPSALDHAAALDFERMMVGSRGPLHGIPILLKDNIATLANEGKLSLSNCHDGCLLKPGSVH